MDLSIIIVNWNARDYLLKCLRSIVAEADHLSYEIVVVDNASTDGSPEHVRNEFSNIKLIINKENLGFAKANNIGIRNSIGEYICLVNSDVIVLKDCFKHMLAYMKNNLDVGMLGPKILNPDRTLQPSCMGFPTPWNMFCRAMALDSLFPKCKMLCGRLMTYWPHNAILNVEVLNGCFWMVKRTAVQEVGFLDEDFFFYGEDIDWCKRFNDSGWQVVFYPGAEAVHYGGASSANAPIRFYLEMHKADLHYWKKHHSRPAQTAYILSLWLHHLTRILGQTIKYVMFPSRRNETEFKIKRSLTALGWLIHPITNSR